MASPIDNTSSWADQVDGLDAEEIAATTALPAATEAASDLAPTIAATAQTNDDAYDDYEEDDDALTTTATDGGEDARRFRRHRNAPLVSEPATHDRNVTNIGYAYDVVQNWSCKSKCTTVNRLMDLAFCPDILDKFGLSREEVMTRVKSLRFGNVMQTLNGGRTSAAMQALSRRIRDRLGIRLRTYILLTQFDPLSPQNETARYCITVAFGQPDGHLEQEDQAKSDELFQSFADIAFANIALALLNIVVPESLMKPHVSTFGLPLQFFTLELSTTQLVINTMRYLRGKIAAMASSLHLKIVQKSNSSFAASEFRITESYLLQFWNSEDPIPAIEGNQATVGISKALTEQTGQVILRTSTPIGRHSLWVAFRIFESYITSVYTMITKGEYQSPTIPYNPDGTTNIVHGDIDCIALSKYVLAEMEYGDDEQRETFPAIAGDFKTKEDIEASKMWFEDWYRAHNTRLGVEYLTHPDGFFDSTFVDVDVFKVDSPCISIVQPPWGKTHSSYELGSPRAQYRPNAVSNSPAGPSKAFLQLAKTMSVKKYPRCQEPTEQVQSVPNIADTTSFPSLSAPAPASPAPSYKHILRRNEPVPVAAAPTVTVAPVVPVVADAPAPVVATPAPAVPVAATPAALLQTDDALMISLNAQVTGIITNSVKTTVFPLISQAIANLKKMGSLSESCATAAEQLTLYLNHLNHKFP